jgi:ubiquinone/menaquinone biosynthesis C-methylase UbiE
VSADEDFYSKYYAVTTNQGATGILHKIAHRQLESNLHEKSFSKILEIGANDGEHFKFVKIDFDEYVMTDISYKQEKEKFVFKNRKVAKQYADVQKLPFKANSFQRVITSCVLHHVANPFQALEEIRRVCQPGGTVSIHLSADPSILYRALWRVGSERKLKKLNPGLDYRFMHAREHVGNCFSIEKILKSVFSEDRILRRRFPFPWSWNLNLHSTYQIKVRK